jgi:hypothetical protein
MCVCCLTTELLLRNFLHPILQGQSTSHGTARGEVPGVRVERGREGRKMRGRERDGKRRREKKEGRRKSTRGKEINEKVTG